LPVLARDACCRRADPGAPSIKAHVFDGSWSLVRTLDRSHIPPHSWFVHRRREGVCGDARPPFFSYGRSLTSPEAVHPLLRLRPSRDGEILFRRNDPAGSVRQCPLFAKAVTATAYVQVHFYDQSNSLSEGAADLPLQGCYWFLISGNRSRRQYRTNQ